MFDVAISADEGGQLQYWGGPKQDYKMPKCVRYDSAMDTDLYTYVVVSLLFLQKLVLMLSFFSSSVLLLDTLGLVWPFEPELNWLLKSLIYQYCLHMYYPRHFTNVSSSLQERKQLFGLLQNKDQVREISFAPNGKKFAVASSDKKVR